MNSPEYTPSVNRLTDGEPHSGGTHAGRLELTDADVATVLADAVNGDDARGARAALAEYRRRFPR